MLARVDTGNYNALVFADVEALHDLPWRYFGYRRISDDWIGIPLKHTSRGFDAAFADRLGRKVFFGNSLKRVFVLARVLPLLFGSVFSRVNPLLNK